MENVHTSVKTSIKWSRHDANMTTNTNILLKHVHDARIIVMKSEKECKSCDVKRAILGVWRRVIGRASFREIPGNDWWLSKFVN